MNAIDTLNAWKDYARTHSGGAGADNAFAVGETSYYFDPNPRALHNGALQGRFYRKARGENMVDAGGFKIDSTGVVVAIPDALRDVLPLRAPDLPARPDAFHTDDVEEAK